MVTLTWRAPDADTDPSDYRILRHRPEAGETEPLGYVSSTGNTATSFTDTAAEPEVLYVYRVQASDVNGQWGEVSEPVSIRVPRSNSPATGAPVITGMAQVGQTLTMYIHDIADADGMENTVFRIKWLADGMVIQGVYDHVLLLVAADEGKRIEVRVSFTDDAGNEENLTSAATDAVAAAEPSEPPAKPTGLTATASHGQVVLTWDDPGDDSITGYVILRRIRENDQGGEFSELVADTGTAATTYTDDTVDASTHYTYRIKAINEYGVSERSRWYHIDTPAAP